MRRKIGVKGFPAQAADAAEGVLLPALHQPEAPEAAGVGKAQLGPVVQKEDQVGVLFLRQVCRRQQKAARHPQVQDDAPPPSSRKSRNLPRRPMPERACPFKLLQTPRRRDARRPPAG